jgi:polyisoprenoid-binding protein YceI
MRIPSVSSAFALTVLSLIGWTSPATAQQYTIDPGHAAVTFRISHLGLSWTHGRFNAIEGDFTIDRADATKSKFNMAIASDSIDTGNKQRDDHLRSPDFLNVKQFPEIAFRSTSVKETDDGYEVAGDFTLHGVTKPIVIRLVGGKTAEFPKGVHRTGFTTSRLSVKRSDFDMGGMNQAIGDEVVIAISFEGTRQ